jgi:hypothetical protein
MSLTSRFDLVIFDWAGTMVDFGCEACWRNLQSPPPGRPVMGAPRRLRTSRYSWRVSVR